MPPVPPLDPPLSLSNGLSHQSQHAVPTVLHCAFACNVITDPGKNGNRS